MRVFGGFLRLCPASSSSLTRTSSPGQPPSRSTRLTTMTATSRRRIHVQLQNVKLQDKTIEDADFTKCIIEYFGSTSLSARVHAELKNNSLIITNDCEAHKPVMMKHPPFCPMQHLSPEQQGKLPAAVLKRGVDVGAVVLLESGDNKLLLSRRAAHLNIFPSIWVPPGGHIEENETLSEAGLRELEEETGLRILQEDLTDQLQVLGLWESVYPAKLAYGLPQRHHVVVYLHGQLKSDLTSDVLQGQIKMDPNETDACMWLERKIVEAIVLATEENTNSSMSNSHLPETVKALALDDRKDQVLVDLPLAPLLERSGDTKDQLGRVSTGTKMAMEEWLGKE